MSRFILALDQGTTSSRAILYDRDGRPTGQAQREFEQRFPTPGWVEHDPEAIWSSQLEVAEQVLAEAGVSAADVAAIGITNQRETTLVWDRKTGEPIYPAIVWQDRRTAGACAALREAGHEALVQQRAGLVLDAYFSASKVRWILDHVEGAHERAERGELAFGTVDSWLVYRLTDGQCHVTDPTNASRTMLYDLQRGAWDDELLQLFGLSASLLPRVLASSGVIGEAAVGGLKGIAIASIVGDQQAALFGQRCTRPGMVKNTYGTGCFMLMHTGEEKRDSKHRLLTTAAAGGGGKPQFALEGSVFIGGAVVQWLRDGLGLVKSAAEVERLASTVEDNGGVYLVPAFAGLGAPYWDPLARGVAMGLTRGTTAGHLARAALEGIAFQVADVLDVMQQDAGTPIRELRVDGGAAANDLLMQFQADVLRVPVVRPVDTESTALGAAYLAGLATGFWADGDELDARWQAERTFEPAMDAERATWLRGQWSRALSRCRDWDRDEEAIV